MKKCKELFMMEEEQFRILQRENQKLRRPKDVTKGGGLENHNKDNKDSSFGPGDIIQQLRAHTGLAKDLS